jgi:hypothetical protein
LPLFEQLHGCRPAQQHGLQTFCSLSMAGTLTSHPWLSMEDTLLLLSAVPSHVDASSTLLLYAHTTSNMQEAEERCVNVCAYQQTSQQVQTNARSKLQRTHHTPPARTLRLSSPVSGFTSYV